MKNCFYLLAFILLVSCSTVVTVSDSDICNVSVDYCDETLLGKSLLTGEHHIIPLSAPVDEAIIKEIGDVIFAGGRIFVADRAGNKVVAFDGSGKYIASTERMIGKGHNEYIRMADAVADSKDKKVYVFCDAPYCVVVLDFDLRFIKKISLDYYVQEVAMDKSFIYGLKLGDDEDSAPKVIAIDKNDIQKTPKTILTTDKYVRGVLMGLGKTLVSFNDTVYASLPLDNRICKIADGQVKAIYDIDFGGRAANSVYDNLNYNVFLKRNKDSDWIIQNMTGSDSLMLFNTNSRYTYVIEKHSGKCRAYPSYDNEYFPFSSSLMLPAQGLSEEVVYEMSQDKIKDYIESRKRKGKSIMPLSLEASMKDCDWNGNPVLVVWKIK